MRIQEAWITMAVAAVALGPTAWAQGRGEVVRVVEGDPVVRLLPRDAIPAVDRPRMIRAEEAGDLLVDHEPVLGVEVGGEARAYPLWTLDAHEIVNDRVGDLPIAATW